MSTNGVGLGTVRNFSIVLTHKLTQYDQRLSKRERTVNIYRLGHLLAAADKVSDAMRGDEDKSDAATVGRFAVAMKGAFAPGFPPVVAVEKQIVKWLEAGRNPSIVDVR